MDKGLPPPPSPSSERRGVKLVPLLRKEGVRGWLLSENYARQHTSLQCQAVTPTDISLALYPAPREPSRVLPAASCDPTPRTWQCSRTPSANLRPPWRRRP